jgi:hypothetical protein
MNALEAPAARKLVAKLAARLTEANSTIELRQALAQIEAAFAAGADDEAARLIDEAASHVCSFERLEEIRPYNSEIPAPPYPGWLACVATIDAYRVLSDVRLRFGLLVLRRHPSNISVL